MDIYGVRLEVIRQRSQGKFEENTEVAKLSTMVCTRATSHLPALIDACVVLYLGVTPVGQAFGMVIDLSNINKSSITSNKSTLFTV